MKPDSFNTPSMASVTTVIRRAHYHWSLILLHWVIVALVIVQYVTSAAMLRVHRPRSVFARPDPLDLLQHTIHIRVGLVIIALMVIRAGLRWRFGAPEPLVGLTSWQINAAKAVHFALYATILAQGITGAVAIYFWWPVSAAHVVLFKVLLGLIVLHIAAALWHQFFLKDGGLRRILGI